MAFKETVRSILEAKGRAVWSVAPDARVLDAVAILAEKDIGALVVLSGGRLVGMFSERDYARKLVLQGKTSKDTKVSEVMSVQVYSVDAAQTVDDCMRLMTQHRIRHLPVLEDDVLIGVVSIGDLVNAIISAQAQTIQQLSSYISGKYPG
jgi:CBS domain-containing protein